MLNANKSKRLLQAVKAYSKKYLSGKLEDLDESGTRLMVNSFLTDILGFISIEEVKTEYMIRGTYADYVIQTGGERHFLVEVKAYSLNLSDKHIRQAINYGANEGIDWAILTNGRIFQLYKILFNKPIESKLVFEVDLSDQADAKRHVECLQYLHKDAVIKGSLNTYWNRCVALEPYNIAGLIYTPVVSGFIKRQLRKKYKTKFSDAQIEEAIDRMLTESVDIEKVQTAKLVKSKRKKVADSPIQELVIQSEPQSQETVAIDSPS